MTKAERNSLIAVPMVVLLGAGLAAAGSQGGATVSGLAVFAIAVATAFVIQWVVFVPSYLARTERFFDLTGSVTYIAVTLGLLLLAGSWDARRVLLAVLVLVWAVRLGIFLFGRVSRSGADDRFDEIKGSFPRFLAVWTIQGLWVSVTAAAAWIAISASRQVGIDAFAVVGFLLWAAGFAVEVVADQQKSRFRADPAHRGRFISTGLWSRSRHPNYFGEILLWIGVAVIALPVLDGWQWVGLVSPVFVAVLITRVSGVPLLEAKAEAKWGGQPDYEEYKQTTPVLVPRLR
jgi:steroid 5-alpha reductase family enzyme